MDAIDCQGFAGGFTMGVVQAGFRLVAKREHVGGFGVPLVENNRHLLGDQWTTQCSVADEWEPYHVPLVFGNPPCSGFSTLSMALKGVDAAINSCMWDFVRFGSRCQPELMIFESVTNAFKNGRGLMLALREEAERLTGRRWDLTHVLHNAHHVGGAPIRKRYFFVLHAVPFGIHDPGKEWGPVLHDVISDLLEMENTWEPQPYRWGPTWWSAPRRSSSGMVDGCFWRNNRMHWDLIAEGSGITWEQGERVKQVMVKYWEKHGRLPPEWDVYKKTEQRLAEAPDFQMGFAGHQASRWVADQPARVIDGNAIKRSRVIHPYEDRVITHREALRIMGFPDDWRVAELADNVHLASYYGKGVTVDCGRWIATAARLAIQGEPGEIQGELIGDRERLTDFTKKVVCKAG